MNRVAFSLGSLDIYWYAIFILLGILVGYFFGKKIATERGIDKKDFDDLVFYGLIFSIIGARLYYVIFNLGFYLENPIEIIMVREGGLAIHGGIIVAFSWAVIFSKKRKINMLDIFDASAIGFMIAQSIGRWGNFINQEAHGGRTTREFLENLHLPNFIVDGMNIFGVYYHPTFLYESIWNFIGFLIAFIFRNKLFNKKGDIFCFFIVWYSFIRFFIESMRTDSLMLGDIKVAQAVSILGIIFGIIFYFKKSKYNLGDDDENSNDSLTQG